MVRYICLIGLAISCATPRVLAAPITINVQMFWTDSNDNTHPARGVLVEFWDNDDFFSQFSSDDEFLGMAETNADGIATTVVENEDPDDSGTIDLAVRTKHLSSLVNTHETSSSANTYGFTFTTGDNDIAGPEFTQPRTVSKPDPKDGFYGHEALLVHQAVQFMADYATNVLGASTGPMPLPVRYDIGIDLSRADANSMRVRRDAWDEWDVIQHEFGHVIAHNNNLHGPPVTGDHGFGMDTIGTLGAADGTRQAWDEGIATYLALSAQKAGDMFGAFGGNLPASWGDEFYNNDPNNLNVSIEDESGNVGAAAGEGDELSVARIAWDLFDNDVESYGGDHGDTFALGDVATFQLMQDNYTLHSLWKAAVGQYATTYQRRAELGEIFQAYNVSAKPIGPSDNSNFDATKVDFSFEEQNSDHSDQFQILVFNQSMDAIIDSSPMLDSNTTQWQSNIKFLAGNFHWVVISDSVIDAGGEPLTDFYWSSKHNFFINFAHPSQYIANSIGNDKPNPTPGELTNGDFQIIPLDSSVGSAGDGLDEQTRWIIDFAADPDSNFTSTSGQLELARAVLTLRLTAGGPGIADDLIMVDGLDPIASPLIQSLTPGQLATVQIDLLDFYTSPRLLAILNDSRGGQLPFTFTDDALISYARLDMIPIPEPATLVLLMFAAVGCCLRRGRAT